jgi:hypothetical protein
MIFAASQELDNYFANADCSISRFVAPGGMTFPRFFVFQGTGFMLPVFPAVEN